MRRASAHGAAQRAQSLPRAPLCLKRPRICRRLARRLRAARTPSLRRAAAHLRREDLDTGAPLVRVGEGRRRVLVRQSGPRGPAGPHGCERAPRGADPHAHHRPAPAAAQRSTGGGGGAGQLLARGAAGPLRRAGRAARARGLELLLEDYLSSKYYTPARRLCSLVLTFKGCHPPAVPLHVRS